MSDAFELVVAFDRDAPEFARGVEIGMLYERLRTESLPLTATIHASNAELVMRLAETMGVSVQSEEVGDDWITVWYGTTPSR